jgi:hypothetical protein
METLTLKQFYDLCPDKLDRPANITIVGGLLWRGYIEETSDIDLFIWGVDKRPEIIAQLQKLTAFKIVAFYIDQITYNPATQIKPNSANAPLYINGVKVPSIPICPLHIPDTKEKFFLLEQKTVELDNRLKAVETKAVKP